MPGGIFHCLQAPPKDQKKTHSFFDFDTIFSHAEAEDLEVGIPLDKDFFNCGKSSLSSSSASQSGGGSSSSSSSASQSGGGSSSSSSSASQSGGGSSSASASVTEQFATSTDEFKRTHHLECNRSDINPFDRHIVQAIGSAQNLEKYSIPYAGRPVISTETTNLNEESIGKLLLVIYEKFNTKLEQCVNPFRIRSISSSSKRKEAGMDVLGITKQVIQTIFDFIKRKGFDFILNEDKWEEKIQALGFIIIHSTKHISARGVPPFIYEFLSMYKLDTLAVMLTIFQSSNQIAKGDKYEKTEQLITEAGYTMEESTPKVKNRGGKSKKKSKTFIKKTLGDGRRQITLIPRHNPHARVNFIFDQQSEVSKIIISTKQSRKEPHPNWYHIPSLSNEQLSDKEKRRSYMKKYFKPHFLLLSNIQKRQEYIDYIQSSIAVEDSFSKIVISLRLAAEKMMQSPFFDLIAQIQTITATAAYMNASGINCENPVYRTPGLEELKQSLLIEIDSSEMYIKEEDLLHAQIKNALSLALQKNPFFITDFLKWCTGWTHLEGNITIQVRAQKDEPGSQQNRSIWTTAACLTQIGIQLCPKDSKCERDRAEALATSLKYSMENSQGHFELK